jgi:hypothetical protein
MVERRRLRRIEPSGEELLDYDTLKAFAAELGRPAKTMLALAPNNDPFSITPGRRAWAEWFASIWQRLDMGHGAHLRRVHYATISQENPIKKLDGTLYTNTTGDWNDLAIASRDARLLDLVPAEDFVDRRNNEPFIRLTNESEPGFLTITHRQPEVETAAISMPDLPRLLLSPPTVLQPYHVEIWCEKTTANDVLEPLAEDYDLNVITGSGELSVTACVNVVERAEQSGRPVRILYVSDFDPKGRDMPVSVARKIEHRVYLKGLNHLKIQLRPIVLTHEQCIAYRLPRTPIKDRKRAAAFAQRFGAGATELDALEALRPGEPRNIIEREIERYYDPDLDHRVREKAAEIGRTIAAIHTDVRGRHQREIKALAAEWKTINEDHSRQIAAWAKRAKPVWHAVTKSLAEQAPDFDRIDWPEPADGDEDDDPLFDSTRSYVEQINRYKRHQGKVTTRKSGLETE